MSTFFFLLLLPLLLFPCISCLDHLYSLDPDAVLSSSSDVWFEALSEQELSQHWSTPTTEPLVDLMEKAQSFETTVFIDVKLVGFVGDGDISITLNEHDLLRYLEASGLSSQQRSHVINTKSHSHSLPFRTRYLYRVARSRPTLIRSITNVIRDASLKQYEMKKKEQEKEKNTGSSHGSTIATASIPVTLIDSLIAQDYAESGLSYTLYILNPSPPIITIPDPISPTPKRHRMHYVYTQHQFGSDAQRDAILRGDDVVTNDTTSSQHAFHGLMQPHCPVMSWVGTTTDHSLHGSRYAWIDLTAGPVTYGPHADGDGIVTEFTLPRVARLFHTPPHTSPDPAEAAAIRRQSHQLIAEIAATVRHTTSLLISPPIHRFPIPYKKKTLINLIYIHDVHVNSPAATTTSSPSSTNEEMEWSLYDDGQYEDGGIGLHRRPHMEWAAVANQLESMSMAGQTIDVIHHHLRFDECELCVAAYTHSLKSFAVNGKGPVGSYLDSHEMHDWLEHYDNTVWGIRSSAIQDEDETQGDAEDNTDPMTLAAHIQSAMNKRQHHDDDHDEATGTRILTAFIYDLSTDEIILLDREYQSIAFDDIIIAVQTRAHTDTSDMSCGGITMSYSPRDASRAVLGTLLQSGWGITPTHLTWNEVNNSTDINYLWSIGPTPYGYFSDSKLLSWSQRDAGARHIVYSEVAYTMDQLKQVVKHIRTYNLPLESLVSPATYLNWLRRWNVLSFKLSQTRHFLSLQQYNQSLYYVRSAYHDVKAMHHMLHDVTKKIKPVMHCSKPADSAGIFWRLIFPLLQLVTLITLLAACAYYTSPSRDSSTWNPLKRHMTREIKGDKKW